MSAYDPVSLNVSVITAKQSQLQPALFCINQTKSQALVMFAH